MKETYDIRVMLERNAFVDAVESLCVTFGELRWNKAVYVLAKTAVVCAVRAAHQDERGDYNIRIDLADRAMQLIKGNRFNARHW